jgi:hypothetical protein
MATFKKEKNGSGSDTGFARDAEAEVRRELGIETLADDEELMGDSMFSKMHEDLVLTGEKDDGAEPAEQVAPELPGDFEELDELLLEEVATELPEDPAVRPGPVTIHSDRPAPPSTPAEVAALEAEIHGAADRSDVAQLALQLAQRYTRVAALLVVNQGVIAGFRGAGDGLEQRIEGVMISQSVDSVFAAAASSGEIQRRTAPFEGMDARLLGALDRRDAQQILVAPVAIRGRVVNLLYADNGSDPLPQTSAAALEALCDCVADVYTRLIFERKQRA